MPSVGLVRASGTAPAAAWFIAGSDAAAWLAEIASWNCATSPLRCLVIPRGRADRSPEGLLVIGLDTPPRATRAIPYARIGEGLYLPSDAALDPPLGDSEADAAITYAAAVFHPAVGLVGFTESDLLRCGDLVQAPRLRPSRWTAAVPGVSDGLRLAALMPMQMPTVEQVISESADDIGSEPPTMLPRDGQEGGTATSLARWLRLQAANAIDRLADLAPRTASQPTWINRVQDWARNLASDDRDRLADRRHEEIARLLRAFETDPDRALRFAIPLAGDPHRGLTAAGTKLGPRNTDFDLRRLGGGPIDPWSLPQRMRLSLAERYRSQAQREVALGRHRRAAYIHAHLLGDFAEAAKCLELGGHFREAAAVHRDRLRKPRDAAMCLERGGLRHEAIAIWTDLGEHERVGDNYHELGDRDAAVASWRRAAEAAGARQDALAAARLLDEKIEDADAALAVLAATWPAHPQAAGCLALRFDILGRVGRHEQAKTLMGVIAEETPAERRSAALTSLISAARRYPDAGTRQLAGDAGRLVVAAALAEGEGRDLLPRLAELDPSDRLLARDAARCLDRPPKASRPRLRARPMLQERWLSSLPEHRTALYVAAIAERDGIVTASFAPDGLRLTETGWSYGPGRHLHWHGTERTPLTMFGTKGGIFLLQESGRCLVRQHAARDDHHAYDLIAGSLEPIEPRLLAAGPAADFSRWLLVAHEDHSLLKLAGDRTAPPVQLEGPAVDPSQRTLVDHLGPHPLVANAGTLTLVRPGSTSHSIDLGSGIRQIARHSAHPGWTFLALEVGVAAVRPASTGWTRRNIAESLGRPVIGFTNDGLLVVASGRIGRHYRLDGDQLQLVGSEWELSRPQVTQAGGIVAVVAGHTLAQAALLFDNGAIALIEPAG